MKKCLYALCVLILSLVAYNSKAQEYTFTPSDSVFQYQAVVDSYNTGAINEVIYFHNNGPKTIAVLWTVESYNSPNGWGQVGLCDNNTCYYDADSNFFKAHITESIPVGDSCMLKAEFASNCISGDGLMKVSIHAQQDTNPPTVITFSSQASANCTLGINTVKEDNSIHVYPNPSADLVYLSGLPVNNALSISLMDIEGRVVETYTGTGTEQMKLDVSHLSAGLYLLKVFDQQNEQVFTGKVSKL